MSLKNQIQNLTATSVASNIVFDSSYFDWSLTECKDSTVGIMYIIEVNNRLNIFCAGHERELLAWVNNEFQSEINRISY